MGVDLRSHEGIKLISRDELLSADFFQKILEIEDELHRQRIIIECEQQAGMLKISGQWKKLFNMFREKYYNDKKEEGQSNFTGIKQQIKTGEWTADDLGIRKRRVKRDGEILIEEASRMAILPTKIYTNIDTDMEKIGLRFRKNKKWKNIIVDRSLISVNSKITDLADNGIDVTSENAKNLINYFYDCLTINDDKKIPFAKSCSRLGWVGDKFIPYDDDIIFDGEQDHKHIASAIETKGSEETWFNLVSDLRESLYFKMQFATSIVAPLISKLSVPSFIVHFYGLSGSGKTVGAAVASSIWGSGEKGKMWRSVNGTNNWLMDLSAFLKNLPVVLDDTQDIKDKAGKSEDKYDGLVMQLSNGCERGRMKGSESQKVRTWETVFIFNGEESLVKDNSGGGVYNRVIEVDVSGKMVTPNDLGRDIIALVSKNYGFMGPKLIEIYSKNLKEIEVKYEEIIKEIRITGTESTGKQNICIALIILGDWIATKYFLKNEKPLKYKDLKEFSFDASEVDPSERSYMYIKDKISINIKNFIVDMNDVMPNKVWGRIKDGNIFISQTTLNDTLKEGGFDFKAVKKSWGSKGYIIKNKHGKYVHPVNWNGVSTGCICIDVSLNIKDAEEIGEKENPYLK